MNNLNSLKQNLLRFFSARESTIGGRPIVDILVFYIFALFGASQSSGIKPSMRPEEHFYLASYSVS